MRNGWFEETIDNRQDSQILSSLPPGGPIYIELLFREAGVVQASREDFVLDVGSQERAFVEHVVELLLLGKEAEFVEGEHTIKVRTIQM